jgi:hypothetical protein
MKQKFRNKYCHALEWLGLSAFTSRILATGLSQSHCNFKLHMKPSFHILIHFLPLFWNCQFRRLDSIQFLCSQAHIPAGWRLETQLSSIPLFPSSYPGRLTSRNSTQFNSSVPKLISWQADVSKLDSIQFLCSQPHFLAGWRLQTRLEYCSIFSSPAEHFL